MENNQEINNLKKNFFAEYDDKFLPFGFRRVEENDIPLFFYQYDLMSESVIKLLELERDDIPCLLIGSDGSNTGFCLYTGSCFVWLEIESAEEAIKWSSKILNFESLF